MQECVCEREPWMNSERFFGSTDFSYVHSYCLVIAQINKSVSTIEEGPAKTENSEAFGHVYESY